jgi:hypothetical protein
LLPSSRSRRSITTFVPLPQPCCRQSVCNRCRRSCTTSSSSPTAEAPRSSPCCPVSSYPCVPLYSLLPPLLPLALSPSPAPLPPPLPPPHPPWMQRNRRWRRLPWDRAGSVLPKRPCKSRLQRALRHVLSCVICHNSHLIQALCILARAFIMPASYRGMRNQSRSPLLPGP